MSRIIQIESEGNGGHIGYSVFQSGNDWESYRIHGLFCTHLAEFQTYGDGLCQHAPNRNVQDGADCLHSLCKWLAKADQEDKTWFYGVFCYYLRPIRVDIIKMLGAIDYKPGLYFSTEKMEVSKKKGLAYDRRFHLVPEEILSMSTTEKVLRLATIAGHRQWDALSLAMTKRQIAEVLNSDRYTMPEERDLGSTLTCFEFGLRALEYENRFNRTLECNQGNLDRNRRTEVAKESGVAA